MQFKHPEILYALLLLAIPIIIHLFQLRRFKKELFTNVAFLKAIELQTRQSARIKKWLVLLTRLLLLASIVLAFAQPYTTDKKTFNTKQETVIYLDNSLSMQAKGPNGTLLQQAVNELMAHLDATENFTLMTNTKTFRNTHLSTLKNELLDLKPKSTSLSYNAALMQAEQLFDKTDNSVKNLIFISDFQQKDTPFDRKKFDTNSIHLVQLQPANTNNLSIDSVFVSKTSIENLELTVALRNQGPPLKDVSIALFNNDVLLAKSAVDVVDKTTSVFTVPNNTVINGKITIQDTQLQFDNTLYFNINKPVKIDVLSINNADDDFLKRVYNDSEFNYQTMAFNQVDYNAIAQQNLIVLNGLETIPQSLATALNAFKNKGGSLLIIPNQKIDLDTYNRLLSNFGPVKLTGATNQKKRVTKINVSHPLYKDDVFYNTKFTNFQYPEVNSSYTTQQTTTAALSFEDQRPFLFNTDQVYVFTAALDTSNSNFDRSPLIVPTLYKIGQQSLKLPALYYLIGKKNEIDIKIHLMQDDILTLVKNGVEVIPQQQTFSKKVTLTTDEVPETAGIYNLVNKGNTLENISFNYNRSESQLQYMDFSEFKNATVSNSIEKVIQNIKSSTKVNALWKWFVIFASLMLCIEMLILKFYK